MGRVTTRLTSALIGLLLLAAAVTTAVAETQDELAVRGEALANADPLAAKLRDCDPADAWRTGFNIGMAVTDRQTLPGPGKDSFRRELPDDQQAGYSTAVAFSLERNRNAAMGVRLTDDFVDLVIRGVAVAKADRTAARARTADPGMLYWLGFDIASGYFGAPALGGQGRTATGPGSLKTRGVLSADGKRGFDAAFTFHLRPSATPGKLAPGTELVAPTGKSGGAFRDSIRALLTTFVTHNKDSGEGSLRDAIKLANARPGTVIQFPRDRLLAIYPTSPLPPITGSGTVLDGPSGTVRIDLDGPFFPPAPGSSYTGPLAWILGSQAGKSADGLVVQASNCTVRGLVISGFAQNQIAIHGSGSKVKGCNLGTTPPRPGVLAGAGGLGGIFGVPNGSLPDRPRSPDPGASGGALAILLPQINHGGAVYVGGGARNTVLGGAEAGAGNTIGGNGTAVQVAGSAPNGTTIRGNVFKSSGSAIVLQASAPRAPEIRQVLPGALVTIQGVLNGVPDTAFAVELYSGGQLIATASVTTDAGGSAGFEVSPSIPNGPGRSIAATATNLTTGDTSAFSAAVPWAARP